MATDQDETYQSKVRTLLENLIRLYNLQSQKHLILQLFGSLTRECLAYPITERLPPFSLICIDGTPIQFSVSLSRAQQENRTLRYVTETCKPVMLLPARLSLTRERIPVILELINATHLQPQINEVLDLLLPPAQLLPDHSMFGVWIGVQHQARSVSTLKIYCNLLWKLSDPWSMFNDTLRLLDRTDVRRVAADARRTLGPYCWPSCVGLEFTAEGFGRVKLYLRGYQLSWSRILDFIQGLDWSGFEPGFVRFHEVLLNGRETYIPRSVVLCIGAPGESGGSYDLKVEVGPQYYLKDDECVRRRIIKLARELMLDFKPYEQMLDVFSNDMLTPGAIRYHDVVGVGFNPQIGPRLNIYLRPDLARYYNPTD